MARFPTVRFLSFIVMATLAMNLKSQPGMATQSIGHVRADVTFHLKADRSVVREERIEMTASSQAGLEYITQTQVSFTSGQSFRLLEAFTRKANGTVIPTTAADISEQKGSVGNTVSFNDTDLLKIAFRDVSTGDATVLHFEITEKDHFIPGQYSFFRVFAPSAIDQELHFALTAPASIHIKHAEKQIAYRERAQGGEITREWFLNAPAEAPVLDQSVVDALTLWPSFGFSTFLDNADIANRYYAVAAGKMVVDDGVRALANQITQGLTDSREQAAAIFDWITTHVRYNAIYFGAGRYEPNDVHTILERRFGDCKDLATLMSVLLLAKGIDSEHVLMDASVNSRLPDVPVLSAFSHVLIYIPSLGLYADPTAPLSSLGKLPRGAVGAPVVRVGRHGAVTAWTPLGTQADHTLTVSTEMDLGAHGARVGRTTITATGIFAFEMRAFAAAAETQGSQATIDKLGRSLGFSGTFWMDPPKPHDHGEPYVMRTGWRVEGTPAITVAGWRAPAGLSPIYAGLSVFWSGLGHSPRTLPVACFPGRVDQIVRVKLPPDVVPDGLPLPIHRAVPGFDISREWTYSDGTLVIRTNMEFRTESRICAPGLVNPIAAAMHEISSAADPMLHFKSSGHF